MTFLCRWTVNKLWICGKDLRISTVFPQCLKYVEMRVDFLWEKLRKCLILLDFMKKILSVENRQKGTFCDSFLSCWGKTHQVLLFPRIFVEKCKFDKNRVFYALRQKSVAQRTKWTIFPPFVQKSSTFFQHQKNLWKVNKIKGFEKFSTFSTLPIIY